ncbi:MAG: helix-turn-helix transcriptional regulator [Polyangiaceae bacterium]|nr:helix-turn-helix transcriptional regulator [Polyangiaceae bacterium]
MRDLGVGSRREELVHRAALVRLDVAEGDPAQARERDDARDGLDAARRVLLRNGLPATTLEAVAKEVGLTKAALNYYYPSKDAFCSRSCSAPSKPSRAPSTMP